MNLELTTKLDYNPVNRLSIATSKIRQLFILDTSFIALPFYNTLYNRLLLFVIYYSPGEVLLQPGFLLFALN